MPEQDAVGVHRHQQPEVFARAEKVDDPQLKVTMTFLELVENDEFVDRLAYRLARPLIALSLSAEGDDCANFEGIEKKTTC